MTKPNPPSSESWPSISSAASFKKSGKQAKPQVNGTASHVTFETCFNSLPLLRTLFLHLGTYSVLAILRAYPVLCQHAVIFMDTEREEPSFFTKTAVKYFKVDMILFDREKIDKDSRIKIFELRDRPLSSLGEQNIAFKFSIPLWEYAAEHADFVYFRTGSQSMGKEPYRHVLGKMIHSRKVKVIEEMVVPTFGREVMSTTGEEKPTSPCFTDPLVIENLSSDSPFYVKELTLPYAVSKGAISQTIQSLKLVGFKKIRFTTSMNLPQLFPELLALTVDFPATKTRIQNGVIVTAERCLLEGIKAPKIQQFRMYYYQVTPIIKLTDFSYKKREYKANTHFALIDRSLQTWNCPAAELWTCYAPLDEGYGSLMYYFRYFEIVCRDTHALFKTSSMKSVTHLYIKDCELTQVYDSVFMPNLKVLRFFTVSPCRVLPFITFPSLKELYILSSEPGLFPDWMLRYVSHRSGLITLSIQCPLPKPGEISVELIHLNFHQFRRTLKTLVLEGVSCPWIVKLVESERKFANIKNVSLHLLKSCLRPENKFFAQWYVTETLRMNLFRHSQLDGFVKITGNEWDNLSIFSRQDYAMWMRTGTASEVNDNDPQLKSLFLSVEGPFETVTFNKEQLIGGYGSVPDLDFQVPRFWQLDCFDAGASDDRELNGGAEPAELP